ncbi:TPA: hypothetical protein ACWXL4_003061 [Escherichia coli]|uniref:hypothetical protein n=1 Tax=Escherichia coli TaxID=562 RepID=UPI0022281B3E|nr:hypothetical protein [Escherichia coli]MCW3379390.1 hypothetical protein [Escherichia coli]MED8747964.1 hypothetical protein [Escherichia coli]MED9740442.1 hypothetical protein [Escherichia coli]HDC1046557.1 hypothetical protein [Escherichia coli]HDC1056970.1 hypothetical protein [Escherichia coli]
MFDPQKVNENKEAFFLYVNASGELSTQSVIRVVEREGFVQGYSLSRRGFRTFRKDRILRMFDSEAALNEAFNAWNDELPLTSSDYIPPKKSTSKNKFSICFTGFKQSDRARLTEIAINNNFDVKMDVSKSLFILCVGDNKGWRKVQKANDYGALILSEGQFLSFIDTGEIPYKSEDIGDAYQQNIEKDVEAWQRMVEEFSLTVRTVREPRRSTALIANFSDGFAVGWRFAVKEVFKEALDIRLTKVTYGDYIYEVWTQGSSYQFHQGDVFYSDRSGYGSYSEFLQRDDAVVLQVKYECFSGYDTVSLFDGSFSGELSVNGRIEPRIVERLPVLVESQTYDPGKIIVDVFIPNEKRNKLKLFGELSMNQDDFIYLLQSGCYWQKKKGERPELINIFDAIKNM